MEVIPAGITSFLQHPGLLQQTDNNCQPWSKLDKPSVDLSALLTRNTMYQNASMPQRTPPHYTLPRQGQPRSSVSEMRKQSLGGKPSSHTGQPSFLSWTSKAQANAHCPMHLLRGGCDVWASETPTAKRHGAACNAPWSRSAPAPWSRSGPQPFSLLGQAP